MQKKPIFRSQTPPIVSKKEQSDDSPMTTNVLFGDTSFFSVDADWLAKDFCDADHSLLWSNQGGARGFGVSVYCSVYVLDFSLLGSANCLGGVCLAICL